MSTVNLFAPVRQICVAHNAPVSGESDRVWRCASASGDGAIITGHLLDILRIGVSFFDEALLVFKGIIAETGNDDLQLIYREAPGMQSLKRLVHNRGLSLSETSAGEWIISHPKSA